MMGRLWKWLSTALAGLLVVLGGLLEVTRRQKERAETKAKRQATRADTAEARIEQRRRADQASDQAKEEGDARVEQVRDEARSGSRRHFESDGLRDDD
jgi:flagellar biosynthesis/type III secretory pathway M-ring protein FliF/YscJ